MRELEPVRKGVLPPRATRAFTPPLIQRIDYQPKLIMPPTIDAPPDVPMKAGDFGDPHGLGTMSAGMGGPLGLGDGKGTSVGRGDGSRYGDGVDGVYTSGHGVTAPVPIRTVEPEYSESARKAHLSGSVLVYAEIDPEGKPRNLRIVQSMGMGLDEKALEAVAKWLFKPGMKNGRPVTVRATFEVNFRLL
jgi:TonB family protein